MKAFFDFLAANPYILFFFTVGTAVAIGKIAVKGYGLGMVAASIVVGCALSVWASSYGTKLALDKPGIEAAELDRIVESYAELALDALQSALRARALDVEDLRRHERWEPLRGRAKFDALVGG